MNIIVIIKIIVLLVCLTKLSLESAKTVLFRNKLAMLPLPAVRNERLVNLQHQLGKISKRVEDREETLQLETRRGRTSGLAASIRWNRQRGPDQLSKKLPNKEFQSLSEFLPNLLDTDARTLALRMYYLELLESVSPSDAQARGSKMFSISSCTVKRWATPREDTGEEALIDHRGFHEGKDKSILFLSADLVTELKLWALEHIKKGGKHKDDYANPTIY